MTNSSDCTAFIQLQNPFCEGGLAFPASVCIAQVIFNLFLVVCTPFWSLQPSRLQCTTWFSASLPHWACDWWALCHSVLVSLGRPNKEGGSHRSSTQQWWFGSVWSAGLSWAKPGRVSVLAGVFTGAAVQIDLQCFLLAGRVVDPVAQLLQAAALFLQ